MCPMQVFLKYLCSRLPSYPKDLNPAVRLSPTWKENMAETRSA